MTICVNCQEETPNPKYCSRSCAAKQNNKVPKRRRDPQKWCECGRQLRRKTSGKCTVCDPVDPISSQMTLGEVRQRRIDRGRRANDMYIDVRNHARNMVKDLPRSCFICGYDKMVHLAHVKDIYTYPDEATLGEINSLDNLTFLCPNHHWEFDKLPRSATSVPIVSRRGPSHRKRSPE